MRLKYLLFLLLTSLISYAQKDSLDLDSFLEELEQKWKTYYFNKTYPNYKGDYDYKIVDKNSKTLYTVDTTEIFVSAKSRFGKIIWKTDPWSDNELPIYRHNRPVITHFELIKIPNGTNDKKWFPGKEVIFIRYSNSQFGYLNKKSGEFIFLGQD